MSWLAEMKITTKSAEEIMANNYPVEEEIYELKDPRDGQIHYVGRSVDVWQRWYQHQSSPQRGRMAEWIKDLKRNKLSPVLNVVCRVRQELAKAAEAEQIQKRISDGCDLYNMQKPRQPTSLALDSGDSPALPALF